ncbi:MAG: hypothetical protein WA840_12620, partial [Caulobacteraceae bacterium]
MWRDLACEEYDSTSQAPADHGYELEYIDFSCGPLSLAHCRRDGAAEIRTRGHIRKSTDHWLCVQVLLKGRGEGRIGDIRYQSTPNGILIVDMSRPAEIWRRGAETIALRLPMDQLAQAMPDIGDPCGFFPGGLASDLFRDHLRSIMRNASGISLESAVPIFDATIQILAAAILQSGKRADAASPALDTTFLQRSKAYIADNIFDFDLTPETIARSIGVSRRKL